MRRTVVRDHGNDVLTKYRMESVRVIGRILNYIGLSGDVLGTVVSGISHFCLRDVAYCVKRRDRGPNDPIDWVADAVSNCGCNTESGPTASRDARVPIQSPMYTLIVYDSSYGCDGFLGGGVEFVDGVTVKPERGKYVLFDSHEVRRDIPIDCGRQEVSVVHFYR
jgi:hypothetical protein